MLYFLLIFLLVFSGAAMAQLAGNYTIDPNGSGPKNYKNVSAAIADLKKFGVNGAVTFSLSKNIFIERIEIPEISGASSDNFILFKGVHADSTTISFASHNGSERATILLNGADYIKFQNLGVEATGFYRCAFQFANGANYNEITLCKTIALGNHTNYRNIVFASEEWEGGNHGNYNTISNTEIVGGYYGLFICGKDLGQTNTNSHNLFENIEINEVYFYGIYNYYGNKQGFFNCSVSTSYSYGYPLYNFYAVENQIDSCVFTGGNYGVYSAYSKGNTYRRNVISNQIGYNVYNYYSSNELYTGNEINNAGYFNIYNYYSEGLCLRNNSILGGSKFTQYNIASFYSKGDSFDANYVSKAEKYNIYEYYCQDVSFVNNMVFGKLPNKNSYESNVCLYQCKGVHIYNNSLQNAGGGNSYLGDYAYLLPSNIYNYSSSKVDIRNNILVYSGAFKNAVNISNFNGSFSNVNFNNYESTQAVYIDNNKIENSLYTWQKAKDDWNQNAYQIANQFVDLLNGDLHLSGKSETLYGDNLDVDLDFDGHKRCVISQTVGADETGLKGSIPNALFVAPDTVNAQSTVRFINKNGGKLGFKHIWEVNGNWISGDDFLEYSFTTTGYQNIKLYSINCIGADTFSKRIWVDPARYKPVANFDLTNADLNVNQVIELKDLSLNAPSSWKWEISPDSVYDEKLNKFMNGFVFLKGTNTQAQNPIISFNYPGEYSIKLTAANDIGSDAIFREDVIIVRDKVSICGTKHHSSVSTGVISDNGGTVGNYQNNTFCGFLIDPCAETVTLKFTAFDFLKNEDFLRVYDGFDASGSPLWDVANFGKKGISGSISSAYFDSVLVAKSGQMYLEIETDSTGTAGGFRAIWTSSKGKFKIPNAAFSIPDSICVGQVLYPENVSKGSIKSYLWNFGIDKKSVSFDEQSQYIYSKPGKYSVQLRVFGCGAVDTISKPIVVYTTTKKPLSDFEINITRPTTTDIVYFEPRVYNCADKFHWQIIPSEGYKYLQNTSDSSDFPLLNFTKSGTYSVQLLVSNNFGTDTIFKNNVIEVIDYCIPTVTTLSRDLGISKVSLNGKPALVNNSNSGQVAYNDFTNVETYLEIGAQYQIEVERPSINSRVKRSVWIDFDQDGSFSKSELVGSEVSGGTFAKTFSFTFSVPSSARNGGTRMRVASNAGNKDNLPCGTNQYGEYEDYRIYIKNDFSAPIIYLKGQDTILVNQCENFADSGAVVCDNIGGCGLKYAVSGSVNVSNPGVYQLKYTAIDSQNNAAIPVFRTVIVAKDTTKPKFELLGNDTVFLEVFSLFKDPGFNASDACGKPKISIVGKVDTAVLGMYAIDYYASDNENTANMQRIVQVVDRQAPLISLEGNDTVYSEVFTAYADAGAKVIDNYYTQSAIDIQTESNINTNVLGFYWVGFQAQDPSGNISGVVRRYVKIVDRTAPDVHLIGSDTVFVNVYDNFIDLQASGIDLLDGDLGNPNKSGSFYINFPDGRPTEIGFFEAVYIFTDKSGNKDSVTRIIYVVDADAPSIRLKGEDEITICRWGSFNDPGIIINDNYDLNPLVVTDESNFDADKVGEYIITYFAEDQSGNKSEILTRRIYVIDCENEINERISNKIISCYPNPSNGLFTLYFPEVLGSPVFISVYNNQGKIVTTYETTISELKEYSFDLTSLNSGVYIVRIQNPQFNQILRISLVK